MISNLPKMVYRILEQRIRLMITDSWHMIAGSEFGKNKKDPFCTKHYRMGLMVIRNVCIHIVAKQVENA